ncbi:alpha/beta fold hydrolase [Streptomyces sp. 3MP-14]|uniref:Alpha/beta fold hydrolase n=1 Tax=Streptomyces mimosae TaxID=2586635 RepID=A0A5N6A6B9_9ACTN|nr:MULTISPECIES: alpha/beta hydrolase [Streptomyces]KAB8162978.1 alpha/beta fold hydrolase [Streptomyces mimosae]KAB8179193.1 alpha/beta fold hydrolase [Streptomyces sp. 3MP-14]
MSTGRPPTFAALDTGAPAGGAGATLLLVHGWGGDRHEWDAVAAALADRHRLLAPDLPGHGATRARPGRHTPRLVAADLAAWLDAGSVGPVVAVGHSMGGQVVAALAVDHPELTRATVTVATGFGGTATLDQLRSEQAALEREGAAWAARFADRASGPATPPEVTERHRRLLAAADPAVLAAYREAMYLAPDAFGRRPAAEAFLRGRRCPALALHTSAEAAAWEAALPGHPLSTQLTWPDCGHYVHEERPAEVAALIEGWCRRVAAVG